MKRKIVCLTLAIMMSMTQAATVSASREDDLRDEQAWTSQQLDAVYSRMDELASAKAQLQNEIAQLDSDLINTMVTIDTLKGDIASKELEIIKTKKNLAAAQNACEDQYNKVKQHIQFLYEKGGEDAWLNMMMNADNLADLLTKVEYTQETYKLDRKTLSKYENTVKQVNTIKQRYESEKADLEDMKKSYEDQSYVLQCKIDEKKAASADFDNELAYAQQKAQEYADLLAEQTAEINRLEAERIAAEEEARRQAEEEAARAAAAEETDTEEDSEEYTEEYSGDSDAEESNGTDYNSQSDESYENTDSDDVEYDEYGNVIDSDNTVPEGEYYSQQESSAESASSGSGSSVVDYATQFVGNPYVWGGTSLTNGADCSGFVQSVYKNFGVDLPRTSYEQQNAGTEVSYSDAQPGDLICYGSHVAIYMGNGQIVHASNSVDGIKVSNNAAYRTITSVRRLV